MQNKFLSTASIKRLFKKLGGKSISRKACLDFQKHMYQNAEIIGKIAIKNALYEGRKSVKERDINEAISDIKGQEQKNL